MRLASALLAAALTVTVSLEGARLPVPNDEAAIRHALNRLAYGPRPGDVERVREIGLGHWIEQQLQASRISDEALEARLARFQTLTLDAETIARDYFLPARQQRQARQRAASRENMMPPGPPVAEPPLNDAIRQERRVVAELSEAKLLRAAYSARQLEEVLVDFWFNHFNVFARKAQTGIYVGEYERDVIRPHVLGRFRELLGATAKSPAMLIYLDNWQSVAANRQARRRATRIQNGRPPRGLNENYARELLELHTLGADGGYTQEDIVDVARAFTGWTIDRPGGGGFRFRPNMHDPDEKNVLGQTIRAGGMDDGERVLDILAKHPSTARHVAFKLAQRFVSDTPPDSVVQRAARTFTDTDGNLREVVRVIVTSPEFFDPSTRLAKVKTPFEFVVSALRASGAEIRSGQAVIRALAEMGMPSYLCQPPTGYADASDAWVSSGALVTRINFAVALAGGQLRGIQVPAGGRPDALALGSAEFQKQ